MAWRSLSRLFPDRSASSRHQKELRLTEAYNAVFRGKPSHEDQELVLADLAYQSGFSMVSHPSISDQELRHNEGKRFLFAQIWARLTLSHADKMALENAARLEAVTAEDFATVN
jgi:hypothetical protein